MRFIARRLNFYLMEFIFHNIPLYHFLQLNKELRNY